MIPPIRTKSIQTYGTPAAAIDPLIPYLKKYKRIWDPLTGPDNSNLSLANILRQHGFEVFTSPQSFFLYTSSPPGIDAIVTNPPYYHSEPYIKHAYNLGIPFCFLIPITKISNKGMYSMLKEKQFELMILPGRINYVGAKSNAPFPSCWLCFSILPQKIVMV